MNTTPPTDTLSARVRVLIEAVEALIVDDDGDPFGAGEKCMRKEALELIRQHFSDSGSKQQTEDLETNE